MRPFMLRSSLFTAGALLFCTAAFAQNDASSKLHPITSPIKDAGTYHLATDTWTRAKSPTANLGPDIIYNNTCLLYIYYGLSSLETMVDSGRLPSTNSGSVPGSVPGTSDVYGINGFLIAYCGFNAQVDLDIAHYECYSPCTDATQLTPDSVISLAGLPGGGGTASALGCWIVNIDLEGSTFEFELEGDCDRLWDQTPLTDNFGWALTETNPNGNPGGPLLAGDPFGILAAGPSGSGVAFGDGLRCVGGSIIRLQVVFSDAAGNSVTTTGIGALGGVAAGDVKRYQLWARDPNTSPCGSHFNLSNGVEITWTP